MPRRMVIALMALMLAGAGTGSGGVADALPIPTPKVHVEITEPTTQQAQVTESTVGSVDFSGAVHLDRPPVDDVVVVLDIAVDTGWGCHISPSTMVIADTAEHPFGFNVTVPEAAHADEAGHITVKATATGGAFSSTDEATANVTVASYFRVMIESDEPYREIAPREGSSFKLKIFNCGNAVDSFELEILNARELKDAGWSVELDKSSITGVPPQEYIEVTVTARSPQDWTWDIEISRPTVVDIKATSLGARQGSIIVSQTFLVYVYERGFNMPLVSLISGVTVALVTLLVVGIVMRRLKRRKRRMEKVSGEPGGL